jgi:8-oxo-dGTP pyrophosphatase MutT (NUDIX family)
VFCQDKNGKWRVLANKRGDGTPDFQGLWNCPCGYLDFNEDGEKAAQRETYEECGVFVEKSNIKFVNVNTSPSDSRQNVGLRYVSILSGTIDQYVLTDENSEKREVKAIAWIPVEGIEEYKWAFGHEALVAEMYEYAINL